MRILRVTVMGVVAAGFVSCASIETIAPPVSAISARGRDTATLEAGRKIYIGACASCHVAAPVRDHTPAQWPGIIADMAERTKLTPQEERQVLAYVLAASQ
jgi:hypothetical protein